MRLENVGLDDMGEYTCEADNAVGAVASTGNLIVYGMVQFDLIRYVKSFSMKSLAISID